jgi:hypothetical protein
MYPAQIKSLDFVINDVHFVISFLGRMIPDWMDSSEKNERDKKLTHLTYQIKLSVGVKAYSFNFYDSISESYHDKKYQGQNIQAETRPFMNIEDLIYSILACIAAEYPLQDPEDLGYNSDSIRDMAQYAKYVLHSKSLHMFFTEKDIEEFDENDDKLKQLVTDLMPNVIKR